MSDHAHAKPPYVDQVREGTQRYLTDLLEENAKLRGVVGDLQVANRELHERVSSTAEELSQLREARRVMDARLAAIEAESFRLLEQQANVEQQNANLASLYVAAYRLHATLRREEVVSAIHEIVTNLIGCEEFAVLGATAGGLLLSPISWRGVDPDHLAALCLPRGVLDQVLRRGESFVAEHLARTPGLRGEPPINACVAMKLDGRVTGVIVLFRMLEQKRRVEPLDRELLDLLATHAASALYLTGAYSREKATLPPPPVGP